MTELEFAARQAVGIGCAVGIGLERQWRQRLAGLRTTALTATGASGQSTATFTPDEFKTANIQRPPNSSNQGICNAVHPIGAGLSGSLLIRALPRSS